MSEYREFAVETAQKAGKLLMDNHGKMQRLEYKLRTNFKTQVDDQCDRLIRAAITQNFPEHSIYSEEAENKEKDSEFSWVVDPLDGTIPYTFSIRDHFGVSIALVKGKTPVVGVIYAPKRNELYVAEKGEGACCNNLPMKVSDLDDINKAVIALDYGKLDREKIIIHLTKLLSNHGVTYPVSYGCASVSLSLVANGRLNGYVALKLEPWDMAAGAVIIRESGGKVTNISGKEWGFGDESILAANPSLHNRLLNLFHKNKPK